MISGAGTGNPHVVSLVFAAAYAPAQAETLISLNGLYPPTPVATHIVPAYPHGFAWIDPAAFPEVFVADIDRE